MTSNIIKGITNYTEYLRNFCHLQVSFSNIALCFQPHMQLLYPYNSHVNSYCACLKSNPTTRAICIEKQFKVLEKCSDGEFYGHCWAGVEEFVFPIKHEQKILGFISVSGYRGQYGDNSKRIERIAQTYNLDKSFLERNYQQLNTNIPHFNLIRTLINPLCYMLELLYLQTPAEESANKGNSSLYTNILNYISCNYTKNISLDEIADAMHYSKSHIRQLFKKKNMFSISKYITLLRIQRAKELLCLTELPINKIAYEVGYNDPNYFTNVFKKEIGMHPKKYRYEQRQFYPAIN